MNHSPRLTLYCAVEAFSVPPGSYKNRPVNTKELVAGRLLMHMSILATLLKGCEMLIALFSSPVMTTAPASTLKEPQLKGQIRHMTALDSR